MNQSETKTCQQCKNQFTITPDDFNFYKKIQVPPPTWCPDCRKMRRISFRNERALYKRKCDLCGKDIIAVYPQNSAYKVYCSHCWWSDNWDGLSYGMDYDFNKPFFQQFNDLFIKVPKLGVNNTQSVNSDYTNYAFGNKNCYLLFSAWENENVMYSSRVHKDAEVADCYNVFNSDLCYECIDCQRGHNLIFSRQCESCVDSIFLFNCRNCIACANLRNKTFHFLNEPITKQEFNSLKNRLLTDAKFRDEVKQKFLDLKLAVCHKFANLLRIKDSEGDNLVNCKNRKKTFELQDCENCAYTEIGSRLKEEYDISYDDISELIYESMSNARGL